MGDLPANVTVPTSGPEYEAAIEAIYAAYSAQLPFFISKAQVLSEAHIVMQQFLAKFAK